MIGLGMAAIGRPHYINLKDTTNTVNSFDYSSFKEKAKKLLTTAYNSGIRHFDTAPGYGIAEEILAEWLNENESESLLLSTKWGYTYVADFDPDATIHEVKEHSLEKLNEQWAKSSQLFRNIGIYQIHSATLDSGVLENEAVIKRLFELKKDHHIEIGLSSTGDNQKEIILKALTIQNDNQDLFDSFQLTYNLFDQSILDIKEQLQSKKIIVKEALANGRILKESYNKNFDYLNALATKYKVGIDAIALRFVIDSLEPFSVLSGATEVSHIKENLKAMDFSLTKEEMERLKTTRQTVEEYWQNRKKLIWN